MKLETASKLVGTKCEKMVIWLHGLGADGHDFMPIVPGLGLPNNANVQFIFPHAPLQKITIYEKAELRAWYDLVSWDFQTRQDKVGRDNSIRAVHTLVDEVIAAGIPAHDIVIAGFSLGGDIALQSALSYAKPLAGAIGLSTFLAPSQGWVTRQATDFPILLSHGTQDEVVPATLAEQTQQQLSEQGFQPELKMYPMPHCVCEQSVTDIGAWLVNKLILR